MTKRRLVFVSKSVLAVVTLALVYAPSAAAEPIPINWTGTGHGASISATLVQGGTTYSAGWAGELEWLWGDQDPSTMDTVPQGFAQAFYSYCVDFTQYLADPQLVQVVSSIGFTNDVTEGGAKGGWLFNTFAGGIRNELAPDANYRAAALQVAIWEAMYDTAADLGSGDFKLGSGTNAQIVAYANQYLTALYAAGTSAWAGSPAIVLNTQRGQDQITNVPEPQTLALLGLGLCFLAGLARRYSRDLA